MAPGDVCHGPRCSLAGLGPAALEYRSCHWPGGSAGSPQCVRPMGCWFFPVPRPPYVCAASWASRLLFTGVPARCVVLRVRRPGPPGSCSPVCPLGVLCCVCGVLVLPAPVHRCARSVGLTVTVVERSHVPGSDWPALVVVCGGWMTGHLEMGMLTRVSTGSCWVAASALAVAAVGRGAWVVVGGGSWLGLGFGLGRCRLGLRFEVFCAGTRRLLAPEGDLVGPGDILPTGS